VTGRRIAFFGSPSWAVPILQALDEHHQVVLVVTQPDKPVGRGLKLTPCPVAQHAQALGLTLAQPSKLRRNPEFLEQFRQVTPEVAVTAAYGKLLPEELLQIPPYGFLNLHPSALPLLRGPAPVPWTLIEGYSQTEICLMQTDVGMDTGPVISRWSTAVDPHETAPQLADRLRDQGIRLLLAALENLEHLEATPQPAEGSHAPMLDRETGRLRLDDPAQAIYNRHRGVQPWPGTWFDFQGKRIKVSRLEVAEGAGPPGTLLALEAEGLVVATGQGAIRLLEVQPEGKRPMPALDWARGSRLMVGQLLQ
jgi:methionyl-tRNA formyltransferase